MVTVSALRAAGIPAILADFHLHHAFPNLEFGSSRPRILIPHACRDEAQKLINDMRAREVEPCYPCPKCGGQTRRERRVWLMLGFYVLYNVFFPFFRRKRRCGACKLTFTPPAPVPFTADELGYDPEAG